MSTAHAYLAGLIDGEGCVHLDTPGRTYRARVSVGMTEPALPLLNELRVVFSARTPERIIRTCSPARPVGVAIGSLQAQVYPTMQATWGGTLYQARPATARWAAAHVWHMTGSKAVGVLTAVRPFLRLKGEQADLALEVERLRSLQGQRANGQFLWTEETRRACEAIKQQMHVLNSKGPRASALTVEAV